MITCNYYLNRFNLYDTELTKNHISTDCPSHSLLAISPQALLKCLSPPPHGGVARTWTRNSGSPMELALLLNPPSPPHNLCHETAPAGKSSQEWVIYLPRWEDKWADRYRPRQGGVGHHDYRIRGLLRVHWIVEGESMQRDRHKRPCISWMQVSWSTQILHCQ